MAPEQIAGEELSPPTDLFAVGVILFEMCTGCLPFHLPGDQLVRRDCERFAIDKAGASLPSGVSSFLERSLSRLPAARYPDARAALGALSELSGRS